MRPRYETDAHREIEAKAASLLMPRLNCTIRKRVEPTIDWNLWRQKRLIAVAEFKKRNIRLSDPRIQSEGVYLSVSKYRYGVTLSRTLGCQFHFYIWTAEGISAVRLPCPGPTWENTGRTAQTRDAWDIEECKMIPAQNFTLLVDA